MYGSVYQFALGPCAGSECGDRGSVATLLVAMITQTKPVFCVYNNMVLAPGFKSWCRGPSTKFLQ